MGLILGSGTALMALLLLVRFVPKALGLGLWLGTTGFTAATAAMILYMVLKGSP